jgi:hypothetical protein
VGKIIDKIFEEKDADRNGGLSRDEFKDPKQVWLGLWGLDPAWRGYSLSSGVGPAGASALSTD